MKDLKEIHLQVIDAVQKVRLLDFCSWPSHTENSFLEANNKGKKANIKFDYPIADFHENKELLSRLLKKLSVEDPLQIYTAKTIESYIQAIDMIHSRESKQFQEISIEVYGKPTTKQFGSKFSHLEMAKKILMFCKEFDHPYLKEADLCFSSREIVKDLENRSKVVFGDDSPSFVEDPSIISKAAAGSSKIRIRQDTCFNEYDFDQLFYHEVMTHSLTAMNGSQQINLPLLARGAPRTTKTQEGMATFAEVINGSMDIFRLRRLALRIVAIDMGLQGADFYEIFNFFESNCHNPKESFLSASRIFRGGKPGDGIIFTKDNVYLEGLFNVHSFFLWALHTSNLSYIHTLFSGRIDIEDVFLLKGQMDKGTIEMPKFIPDWYKKINLLVGKISFSLLLDNLNFSDIDSHFESLEKKYS